MVNYILNTFLILFSFIIINAQNFEWVSHYASVNNVEGHDVAVDLDGNVYAVGYFINPTTFNQGHPTQSTTGNSGINGYYLSKTDSNGNLLWVKYLECGSYNYKNIIAVDNQGNIYLTGKFNGTIDFDPGEGTYYMTAYNFVYDVFIVKLDTDGNLIWAKQIGHENNQCGGTDIAVDNQGNVYFTGFFNNTIDFDPGENVANLTSIHDTGTFICKFDSEGNYLWAKDIKGFDYVNSYSIAVNNSGDVYTVGTFTGNVDFNPGPGVFFLNQPYSRGTYISKLNTYGNFVWAKHFVSLELGNQTHEVKTDSQKNVYLAGYSNGATDFDTGEDEYILGEGNMGNSSFVVKLNPDGSFNWSKMFAGFALSVDTDSELNVYAAGYYSDILSIDNEFSITSNGSTDIYVLKFSPEGSIIWGHTMGGEDVDIARSIVVDRNNSDNIYVTGNFLESVDFDISEDEYFLNCTVPVFSDGFLLKLSQLLLSVSDENLISDFEIFPNPFTGKISIRSEFEWQNIQLFDSLGREIETFHKQGNTLFTGQLPKGIYFIRFEVNHQKYTKKIIVK